MENDHDEGDEHNNNDDEHAHNGDDDHDDKEDGSDFDLLAILVICVREKVMLVA